MVNSNVPYETRLPEQDGLDGITARLEDHTSYKSSELPSENMRSIGYSIDEATVADGGLPLSNGYSEGYIPPMNGTANRDQASSPRPVDLSENEILPIAVVGMACRFPGGSSDPEKLWGLLANGKSAWSRVPSERFNQGSFEHPSASVGGTFNSKGAHFLEEDISLFDAPAFNISPVEAKAMDPQMRLQLEVAYEALENGGISLEKVAGSKTAVFIGVFSDDYSNMMLSDPESLPSHHVTGTGKAIFANRISYCFDLKGPSLALDTGCSASLVALHQACHSIRSGESEQAIVGGVNLILSPKTMMSLSGLGFLSDEGRCYSFDNRGNGYGRGEGVATVVLKPLERALADGDPIRAVIRNTVVNQDGKTTGLTMPSREAQINLMQEAYAQARLDPLDTQYIEAHGTGTKVGDPIEVDAIATALRGASEAADPLIIGSVKANIGHLESASGLAGLVKAILCLEKGMIPASTNFETENQDLLLSKRRLKVARELLQWPSCGLRRASLNSFGYGGTNAHVIIDAYQERVTSSTPNLFHPNQTAASSTHGTHEEAGPSPRENQSKHLKQLFLLTHRNKTGAERLAGSLLAYLKDRGEMTPHDLHRLAFTTGVRRTKFDWRIAVMASSANELAGALESHNFEAKKVLPRPQLAFIFTGQGAQWYAMGRELIEHYSVFKKALLLADAYLQSIGASWSVMDELLKDSVDSRVNSAAIGQPLCTAVQCALVDLFYSWGIRPSSVIGHSSGEIAAAYACGSLTLHSALAVSYHRGRLASAKLEQDPKLQGGMLAAGLSEAEAERLISQAPSDKGKAVVACINSPRSVTISGDSSAILWMQSVLNALQIFVRKLGVNTAYHSHHMEIVAPSYLAALQDLSSPKYNKDVDFFSSVTGDILSGEALDANYWVSNMTSPVKFSQALQQLYRAPHNDRTMSVSGLASQETQLLLEIGAHAALAGPVKQTLATIQGSKFQHVATLIRGKDAIDSTLAAAADLTVAGLPLNLEAVNLQDRDLNPQVLSNLPPYPWDHSSGYWHESRLSLNYRKRLSPRHPLLGAPTPDCNSIEPSWRNIIKLVEIPWLLGHKIQSSVVYPAAGYITMAIEAALQRSQLTRPTEAIAEFHLKQVSVDKPLLIPDTAEGIETQFVFRPYNSSALSSSDVWDEFRVFSYSTHDGWSEHCRGLIAAQYRRDKSDVENDRETQFKLANYAMVTSEARRLCQTITDTDKLYECLDANGSHFQNAFKCIEDAMVSGEQSYGHLRVPDTAETMPAGIEHPHVLHPTILDACMQMTAPILFHNGTLGSPMVPTFVEEIVVSNEVPRNAGERLAVHSDLQLSTKKALKARITAYQETAGDPKVPFIQILGLHCTALPVGPSYEDQPNGDLGKYHRFQWDPLESASCDKAGNPDDISTAEAYPTNIARVTLLQPTEVPLATQSLASSLCSMLSQRHVQTDFTTLENALQADGEGSVLICLTEFRGSMLNKLTDGQWNALRNILSSPSRVLWVTQGGAMTITAPESGLINGLARSAMSDNPALHLVTLDVDPQPSSPEDTARTIISVLDKAFDSNESEETIKDKEYVQRGGQLYVPRVVEDDSLKQYLTADTREAECQQQPFIQPRRPLRLEVKTPGLLDSLRFIEDSPAKPILGANELKMQPRCFGVNFRDVMIALGRLEETSIMSSEHSGVITEVGSSLTDNFKVGDRICAWGGTPYASSVTVDGMSAHCIPDEMSFEEAASIPIVYATVFYSLIHLARLQKGESVLIHSAAGGVGQAAIMMAKYLQAEVFVTVGNNEKKALVMSKYGIPEDHIFSSRHLTFGAGISRLTGGKGVDVVLNSIAGDAFHETFRCIAKLGRFIEIGKRDILEDTRLAMGTFNKSVTFASVDLTIVFQHDPQLAKRMIGEVFALLQKGVLQPVQPLNVSPLNDIETAFRLIQAGKHTGKVVLKADERTNVKALPPAKNSATFDANASYMIAGGLGGLGRAICLWMAGRGCKNIIALSRSGMKSSNAQDLKEKLESMGLKLVVYACDVGNRQQVEQTVASCAQEMPPIKGLINSGMALHDTTINTMTLADYNAALRPKLLGTLNLHHCLSQLNAPLSFFLLLSSCVGVIGNNGQANYASANTFLDAFARYRSIELNLPTRSLDLGMIAGAGYVAENPSVQRFLTAQGYQPVELPELFMAIEYAITQSIRNADDCQLMLGLTGGGEGNGAASSPINSLQDAKFEYLRRAAAAAADAAAANENTPHSSLAAMLAAAETRQGAHQIILEALMAQVSKVLVVSVEDINPAMSISRYGGDSLAAVEIKNWVARNLDASVGVMEILSGRSLDALAGEVGARSGLVKGREEKAEGD